MRFYKETRQKIHDAGSRGAAVRIRWPAGAAQPEKDRLYRVQAAEDVEKAEHRLKEHPTTCRDVMAEMHFRKCGSYPEGYKPPRPKLRRPSKEDTCIKVIDVEILELGKGWEATVEVYDDPDPVRHTGLKTRVPAGPSPLDGLHEVTELEPEQIVARPTRSEREDEEDSLRLEHKASAGAVDIEKAAQHLREERRRGKPGKLAEQAVERARRRATDAQLEAA